MRVMQETIAALREENDLQRDSIQQLSAQVAAYRKVIMNCPIEDQDGCNCPDCKAVRRCENVLQGDPGAEIMEHMAKLEAVAEAANLILFWRGISETDDKKASDDWVKFLQDNGYWDRYDGCCNCSLCTKAREEYKKSVEKRLYEAVKAYREISQPDPGAEIMERMKKLEAVAEALRNYRKFASVYCDQQENIAWQKVEKALADLGEGNTCT